MVPSFLACRCANLFCKPNRLERGFSKAREKISEETNIIGIIKSRRYQAAAFKLLLTKEQRHTLKVQSRYFAIDPDSDEKSEKDPKKDVNILDEEEQISFGSSSSSETEVVKLERYKMSR